MSSSSQKGDDEKTMRKIRILVSDPDGTDSSSDEEQEKRPGRSKRLFHEIFIDKVEAAAALEQTVMHKDIDSQLHSFSGVIHPYRTQHATVSMDGSPIKKYVGVHRRTRYGKYIAQINDPIMRKNVYLGTFNTAEEAHKAFITRKVDNEKKLASIKGFRCVVSKESEPLLHTEQLDSQLDSFAGAIHPSRTQHATVSMDGSPIKKYVGVHRTRYGKYIAQITDPIMRKKVYLGTFNTAEEAHMAFITRKVDNEKKLASIKGFQCVVSKESEPLLHTEQLDSQLDSFSGAIHASGTTQHTTVGMGGSPLKKYVGVYRRRSGKYSSEIKDPIKKKRVWLGTFNTAEEAHKAYITKKVEIQKKRASRKGFQWVVSKKSEPLPDVDGLNPCRGGSETSYFNEGKMIGEEDVLMQNNGGSNTEQVLAMASLYETSTMCGAGKVTNIGKDGIENNAYSASDESVEDGVGSNGGSGMEEISPIVNGQEGTYGVKFSGTHKSPSSVLEFESSNWSNGGSETSKFNAETLQNMEDSVKGLFLQDLNGALPIIDNHGFLLGKWSWIDDLSICGIEETRHV